MYLIMLAEDIDPLIIFQLEIQINRESDLVLLYRLHFGSIFPFDSG